MAPLPALSPAAELLSRAVRTLSQVHAAGLVGAAMTAGRAHFAEPDKARTQGAQALSAASTSTVPTPALPTPATPSGPLPRRSASCSLAQEPGAGKPPTASGCSSGSVARTCAGQRCGRRRRVCGVPRRPRALHQASNRLSRLCASPSYAVTCLQKRTTPDRPRLAVLAAGSGQTSGEAPIKHRRLPRAPRQLPLRDTL
jgi:hypothetical protein